MKTKIDIKKIKAFTIALALIAFFAGGWIMFIFSEIDKQKEITREVNSHTEEIVKWMHRRDSVFASKYIDAELLRK